MEHEDNDRRLLQQPESVVERMMVHREKFLGFLRARVRDAATAEDILQSAYIKAIEHGDQIREDESAVAWFYRILRYAITDAHRRQSARAKAHEGYATEALSTYSAEIEQTACVCVEDVIEDLKAEYRDAIQQVDLGGESVDDFAKAHQISPGNASVRLYRARKAVAKQLTTVCGACAEHQCIDCTCKRSQAVRF